MIQKDKDHTNTRAVNNKYEKLIKNGMFVNNIEDQKY